MLVVSLVDSSKKDQVHVFPESWILSKCFKIKKNTQRSLITKSVKCPSFSNADIKTKPVGRKPEASNYRETLVVDEVVGEKESKLDHGQVDKTRKTAEKKNCKTVTKNSDGKSLVQPPEEVARKKKQEKTKQFEKINKEKPAKKRKFIRIRRNNKETIESVEKINKDKNSKKNQNNSTSCDQTDGDENRLLNLGKCAGQGQLIPLVESTKTLGPLKVHQLEKKVQSVQCEPLSSNTGSSSITKCGCESLKKKTETRPHNDVKQYEPKRNNDNMVLDKYSKFIIIILCSCNCDSKCNSPTKILHSLL